MKMIGIYLLYRCICWVKYGLDWVKWKGNMFYISNIGCIGYCRVVMVNLKGNIYVRFVFICKL